jgi:hypothetical protein
MKTKKNKSRKKYLKKIERFTKKKKISRNSNKKINGKILEKKEGWKVIEIYGEPFEMGYAHGHLLYDDLQKIKVMFPFLIENNLKIPFSQYLEKSNILIKPILKLKYRDFYEELKGISKGAYKKGTDISVDFLISWNAYESLYSIFENSSIESKQNCSAFIATGNATKNGDIIMAHNTHGHFAEGRFMNVIMYLKPVKGSSFIMQTSAGFISSISDWFICETGIIGCETTIAYTNFKPSFGSPIFCRIREAMQFGKSLDQYIQIMLKDNAGDYSCSWQFGNINTGEIMLFELGLENYNVRRTKNGVFYGMNSVIDFKIRNLETNDNSIFDLEKSTGSRNYRFNQLLNEKYYGHISIDNAKIIISDHYDMYLGKNQMNSRSICKHCEHYPPIEGETIKPIGVTDGKIVNSKMAKKMQFLGRFGSSCGRIFNKLKFLREYPEYEKWSSYLTDFPRKEWVTLGIIN